MGKIGGIAQKNHTPQRYFALKLAICIFGLIGMGISSYLTYIHYQESQNSTAICLFGTNCDDVLSSQYSDIWGIPLSLLGLLMYAVLTAMAFRSLWANEEQQDILAMGIYSLALSGALFTVYLYYLEIFKIHAFCNWCIGSSIAIVIILILSLIDLFTGREKLTEKSRSKGFKLSRIIRW